MDYLGLFYLKPCVGFSPCILLPLSAVFSSIAVLQVFGLLFITKVLNWSCYYFVDLAGNFLVRIILLDVIKFRARKNTRLS
jgi:hypothetical protein